MFEVDDAWDYWPGDGTGRKGGPGGGKRLQLPKDFLPRADPKSRDYMLKLQAQAERVLDTPRAPYLPDAWRALPLEERARVLDGMKVGRSLWRWVGAADEVKAAGELASRPASPASKQGPAAQPKPTAKATVMAAPTAGALFRSTSAPLFSPAALGYDPADYATLLGPQARAQSQPARPPRRLADQGKYRERPTMENLGTTFYAAWLKRTVEGKLPPDKAMPPDMQRAVKLALVAREAINVERMNYFNTENPHANNPMEAAVALSMNPLDPVWLPRLAQMKSPAVQRAILEKAAEFAVEAAKDADTQVEGLSNPLNPDAVGFPVFSSKSTGRVQSPFETLAQANEAIPRGLGEMVRGPEGYRQLQLRQGFAANAERFLYGLASPESLAALTGFGALPTVGKRAVSTYFAGHMAASAYDKWRKGDWGGATFDAILAGLAGLGVRSGSSEQPPTASAAVRGRRKQSTQVAGDPVLDANMLITMRKAQTARPDSTLPPGWVLDKAGRPIHAEALQKYLDRNAGNLSTIPRVLWEAAMKQPGIKNKVSNTIDVAKVMRENGIRVLRNPSQEEVIQLAKDIGLTPEQIRKSYVDVSVIAAAKREGFRLTAADKQLVRRAIEAGHKDVKFRQFEHGLAEQLTAYNRVRNSLKELNRTRPGLGVPNPHAVTGSEIGR